MYRLLQDLRFSVRLIRKRPGMSLLVLAALVLGIGVNSAMFSVVNAALLRPLPISEPDRLIFINTKSEQSSYMLSSYPDFQEWKRQSHSFQSLAGALQLRLNVTGDGPPERLRGLAVTNGFLKTMGVRPLMGRDFTDADEERGSARVAALSYGIWQRRFAGDPAIIGRTIKLDGEVYSIVGVLTPNEYNWIKAFDFWVGIGPFLDDHQMSRETRYLLVFGKLLRGVTRAQAQSEMDAVAGRLATQYPASNKNLGALVSGLADLAAAAAKPLWFIMVPTGLILLLACINVMTVFTANAIERRREFSVRLALGAGRAAIWRQLVIQGLMFAAVGAALGFVVAKAGVAYLIQQFPYAVPRFEETTMDQRVLWFTICLAVVSMLVSCILPGIYTTRLNISSELKGDLNWPSRSRLRVVGQSALIIAEVGLASGLALVSGLLIKSFYEVQKVNLGFNPEHVLSFQITLPQTHYKDDQSRIAFYEKAMENLRAIPGVQSAAVSTALPGATGTIFIHLQVDSQSPFAAERPFVDRNSVLPGFFSTMKMPIVEGRDFTDADRAGSPPVAIVDSVLAARMWPGQNPIGKRLRLADITDSGPPWMEVVGVVGQIKYFGPEGRIERLQVYQPVYQKLPEGICFLVATMSSVASLRGPLQKAIDDLAPDLPLDRVRMVEDYVDDMESGRKVSLLLLSSFAGVGIALGMIGIYGVVSNLVAQRQREIAIRMALGASMANSISLVTRLGLFSALAGIGVGSVLVISVTKIISAFLFGVKPLDAGVYLVSVALIVMLALLATLVPAAAVLRLNPQEVLRK